MDRRRFLQLTASSLAVSTGGIASSSAQAQWPTKNITMIVPFTPGGSTDILARLIGQRFTETWGQGVVTENRPGAGGAVGSVALARAPADGYTVGMGHIGTLSVNPSLYSNLQYDPIKSFAHISMLARVYNVLVVHPSLPVKNVAEFIEYARQNPGKLNYGSGGNGSAAHIATAAFMVATGTQMTHVPYRGTSPAVADLLSGQIQFMMTGGPAVLPHARAGTMRALGVSGPNRLKSDPNIPTIAEAGVPGFDATQWYGMMAPTGTPDDIVAKLTKEVHGALASKAMQEALERDGAEPWPTTPQEFRDIIASETKRWHEVVEKAKIKVE
ncbi:MULTISPECIES: tripartite tricarboxylate transporter substrate binding protein [unclassified Beijerinckia]|uniref:Bug family tripartite tricarboxylate transporter substrate binding protein n=1 Tax=unclassified Beijerinckia TaxID=2638183 RepID=UPI00089585B2|nr:MULTISPECIES: tripartite tricarboxylate transporter substrate binding protein [unclassified Beijerinckia]MDH7796645.1 tripartite-type tricarboxylate transporter receptor subunit TctC [Beijerinckia sp. GAS462]SEC53959.1 Tripartite-type tricarboxylate transporter, receptor component TctC [Beijerinckia sp. 28-YEA-48]